MTSRPKLILPGGSGFLGQSFANFMIEQGYSVVVLTRRPKRTADHYREVAWDGKTVGEWQHEFEEATAVVNFTGKSVDCRYTPENKREIIDSRVHSVHAVAQAIQGCENPPAVVVQAGSLAIYGDSTALCDESGPHGHGFSVEVCQLWEKAFAADDLPHTRKVYLRIAFVLGRDGGALEPLANLTRFFLGGTVGSGKQFISWLHIDDLNRMMLWAIQNPSAQGIYNATGPTPVTNAQFMKTLRSTLSRPWSPPTPVFAVKIGAFFMGTEPDLALTGRNCISTRLPNEGFEFEFTDLSVALADIFNS